MKKIPHLKRMVDKRLTKEKRRWGFNLLFASYFLICKVGIVNNRNTFWKISVEVLERLISCKLSDFRLLSDAETRTTCEIIVRSPYRRQETYSEVGTRAAELLSRNRYSLLYSSCTCRHIYANVLNLLV